MRAPSEVAMRTKPKLAFFIPTLEVGGAERVMVNLLRGLHDHGLEVSLDLLITVKTPSPFFEELPSSVRIIDFTKKRVSRSMLRLIGYLRREKPDALIASMNHTNVIAAAAHALARAGNQTRLVLVEQTMLSPMLHLKLTRFPRLMHLLSTLTYPLADHVVGCSEAVARDLEQTLGLPEQKVRAIYNPVLARNFAETSRERAPHPWLDASDVPVFVGVGRLAPEKDFSMLLEAFALVRRERPARLIIIGQGPLKETLAAEASALGIAVDVEITGYLKNPYALIRKADVFVSSSRVEGLPNTLIEALACGCRVVATECNASIPEILGGRAFARVVPVGNALALATAMTAVLEEPTRPTPETVAPFTVEFATLRYLNLLGLDGKAS